MLILIKYRGTLICGRYSEYASTMYQVQGIYINSFNDATITIMLLFNCEYVSAMFHAHKPFLNYGSITILNICNISTSIIF